MKLTGKVALVTGAASGIGLAMANRFAAAGMHVVLTDIEAEPLDKAVLEVAAHGTSVEGVICDVRSNADHEAAVKQAVALGGVHVLCNNAGVSGGGGVLWESNDEDWAWTIDVNLYGVIRGIRAAVPTMIEQGEGHVVNTASMAGLTSMPGTGAYSVAKHGVVVMSELLTHELAMAGHDGIGVSVLCPGWVATNLMESDRNRPDGPREEVELSPERQAAREALETAFHAGIEPSAVAEAVHQAVIERQFWILTHDDWKPMAFGRAEDILNQSHPQLRPWPT